MSADNQNEPSPKSEEKETKGKDATADTLAAMQAELRAMNERTEAAMAALAAANQRNAPPPEEKNLYEPEQMVQHMEKIFDTKLREEKEKDTVIFQLADEYPEIKTDAKVRQAVLDANKTIPAHLQGTAQGYELAVLKATSKYGIVPRSQRKQVDDEPQYDGSRRDSAARPGQKQKVAAATLAAAELMGLNVNDPEVVKRLEGHTNRDTYSKYR